MLTGNKIYILANIESVQNLETGDREKKVSCAKILVNKVELVGVNTAQLGQIQGFNLSYSVMIPRVLYDQEKFLFCDGELYEVKTLGKAKESRDMLLNVQKLEDTAIKKAIKEWYYANLPNG